MQPEAQAYLAGRLAHLRTMAAPHNRERPDLAEYAWAQIGGALEALRAVGAVTDDEYADWVARAAEAAGRQGGSRIAVFQGASSGTRSVAAVRRMPGGPGAPRVPPSPPQPGRFLRLVPAPDDEREWFGGRLRFIGIEVYDVEVGLLWRMAPIPDMRLALPEETAALERDLEGLPEEERRHARLRQGHNPFQLTQRFTVSDDAGTQYSVRGGSGGGGGDVYRGTLMVQPAPPPEAGELRVDALGELFTIPLPPA